jgi:hypothetical protein
MQPRSISRAIVAPALSVAARLRAPKLRSVVVLFLLLLVLAGTAVRVREAFLYNPLNEIYSDPGRHWGNAREPLSTVPYVLFDQPLFQIWLSIVQKWTLGEPTLIASYTAALSAVTPWLWYRFLRECVRSRALALVGWALLAWLPSWIGIFGYFMTETLFLPLMGASLWQTARARRTRTTASFCGAVALWTLAGLTRGIALPLGGIACALVWIYQRRRVRAAVTAAAVALLIAVPFGIRNHHFDYLWSPIGNGWPGNIYAASGSRDINMKLTRDGESWQYFFLSPALCAMQLAPWKWEPRRAGVISLSIDLRHGERDWQAAYQKHTLHGWAKLRLRWENVILVLFGESWPDNNMARRMARIAFPMRWIWPPLLLLSLGIAALRWRATLRQPLLPALIVTWFVVQAPSLLIINEGRYRKPLEGLLIADLVVVADAVAFRRRIRALERRAVAR